MCTERDTKRSMYATRGHHQTFFPNNFCIVFINETFISYVVLRDFTLVFCLFWQGDNGVNGLAGDPGENGEKV